MQKIKLRYFAIIAVTAAATWGIFALLANIARHKAEGERVVFQIVDLDETTDDPAEWGKNFPRQYDSYLRTVDTERTRHGGSEAFQKLDEFPVWRDLFAGYAFGIDYREERGHAYMLSDQRETERVKIVNQPGACLQCHASTTGAYRQAGIDAGAPGSLTDSLDSAAGRDQLMRGFEKVCAMDYADATQLVQHPVSCIDCHDPKSLRLRVTRPAFFTGIAALAESDYEVAHLPSIARWRKGNRKEVYDPNRLAERQEMRSLVCAQCHVEYYFKGDEKLLTYPWANGLRVEQSEEYYETAGKDGVPFTDWTHKITGAPMLKAQHPEFELWSQGIHARAGVSCADCHMPYKREGAMKLSDHHVRSPLLNTARACQVCHNVTESELIARVETIQDRTRDLMARAETATHDLVVALRDATTASPETLDAARQAHRRAQWRLDFIAAENSMGFHADQESARILAEAIDLARQGQLALAHQ